MSEREEYKWTAQDIANMADHEGGVFSLYERGLDPARIADPVLAAAWRRMDEADKAIRAVKALLPEPKY